MSGLVWFSLRRLGLACGPALGVMVTGFVTGIFSGAGAFAEVDPAVTKAEADRVAVVAKASSCTVAVFGKGAGGGSGVVITPDGYALTNFHVVKPAGNAMRCGMADGKLYDAVIVGVDPTGDVAMIKLLGRDDFPTAPLGDSDLVRAGDWAFAIGNPFLLATDFHPSVAFGIISGVRRYQYPSGTLLEYADCIQTDAAINPGNSGGPLFNAKGELIGINGRGSFEKRGRVNVGVGYAISINQIKKFMGYLRSGRIVDHATLGASVASDEEGRVVVTDILETSDAARRGLRYGDEIVKFGGRSIRTVNGFKNILGTFPRGWRVPLTYRREGEQFDVRVRLSGVHSAGQLADRLSGKPKVLPRPSPKHPKDQDGEKDAGKDKKPEKKSLPKKIKELVKRATKKPMPKVVQKVFKKKKGYANYYFNELNQKRIWDAMVSGGDLAVVPKHWTLTGRVQLGKEAGPFRIVITPTEGEAELPDYHARAHFDDALDQKEDPPGSGGLLVALHLWHRLLSQGLDQFGEIYYLGTVPLPGREGLVDVLVGTHGGVEAKFLFDPKAGRLLAMEMIPDTYSDPCEVLFQNYREVDGRWLPHRLEVRHGDQQFGAFTVEQFVFGKEKKAAAP